MNEKKISYERNFFRNVKRLEKLIPLCRNYLFTLKLLLAFPMAYQERLSDNLLEFICISMTLLCVHLVEITQAENEENETFKLYFFNTIVCEFLSLDLSHQFFFQCNTFNDVILLI